MDHKQSMIVQRTMTSEDEESDSSVGSSCLGSIHELAEYIDTMRDSWKQYLNNGGENVYDLLTGEAVFKIPAGNVKKTELEILFEERDAEEVLENLGFGYDPGTALPDRFIEHENKKAGIKFKLTDLDPHFNTARQDGKIPTRYLEAGKLEITWAPRYSYLNRNSESDAT